MGQSYTCTTTTSLPENHRLIKHSGQVFTPSFLVRNMLDYAAYRGEEILGRHIMDNSCGDGAFLCEAVDRYCEAHLRKHGNTASLSAALAQHIHGIEIEPHAYSNCLYNLDAVVQSYGIGSVPWDIVNDNALRVATYNGKMDFVVGNPPYVRVHNLEDDYTAVKRFSFAQDGMTDLYLVFYELGLNMLTASGRLCYITPNSWLNSVAATNMRRYILQQKTLAGVVDLAHYQAFEKATTYTMITLFDNRHRTSALDYYTYAPDKHDKVFVCRLSYDDMTMGSNFYIAAPNELALLHSIKTQPHKSYCTVKNGFATLADSIFILGVDFDALTIPVLKASTGKWRRAFFPYDTAGKPLSRHAIFSHPEIAAYLSRHKETLLKGKSEEDCPQWYLYGRTQALRDVYAEKYALNTVIRDVASIRLERVPRGAGLYSGLYILTKAPLDMLKSIICSEDFVNYIKALKKYKSGGYYTFNSADVEQYINAKLTQYAHTTSLTPDQQCMWLAIKGRTPACNCRQYNINLSATP